MANDLEERLRAAAARGYCHPKNSHKELDADLLEAICEEIASTEEAKAASDKT